MYPTSPSRYAIGDQNLCNEIIDAYQLPATASRFNLQEKLQKKLSELALEVLQHSQAGSRLNKSILIKSSKEVDLLSQYCERIFKVRLHIISQERNCIKVFNAFQILKYPLKDTSGTYFNVSIEAVPEGLFEERSYLLPRKKVPNPTVSPQLWTLACQAKGDVVLKSGRCSYTVHRDFLVQQHPFFKRIFSSEQIPGQNIYVIDPCYEHGLNHLLRYLYTRTYSDLSLRELIDLLNLSTLIDLPEVNEKCLTSITEFLLRNTIEQTDFKRIWLLAQKFDKREWKIRIIEMVLVNPSLKEHLQQNTEDYCKKPGETISSDFFEIDRLCAVEPGTLWYDCFEVHKVKIEKEKLAGRQSLEAFYLDHVIRPVIHYVNEVRSCLKSSPHAQLICSTTKLDPKFESFIINVAEEVYNISIERVVRDLPMFRGVEEKVMISWVVGNDKFYPVMTARRGSFLNSKKDPLTWRGSPWGMRSPYDYYLTFSLNGSVFNFIYSAFCFLAPDLIPADKNCSVLGMQEAVSSILKNHPGLTEELLMELKYYLEHGKINAQMHLNGELLLSLRRLASSLHLSALMQECSYFINIYMLSVRDPSIEFLKQLFRQGCSTVYEPWVRYIFERKDIHFEYFFEGVITVENITALLIIAEKYNFNEVKQILTLRERKLFHISR